MTTETAFGILAVILVLFLAAATAKAASDKGCSATLWFIAGVLLPGVALVSHCQRLLQQRLNLAWEDRRPPPGGFQQLAATPQ